MVGKAKPKKEKFLIRKVKEFGKQKSKLVWIGELGCEKDDLVFVKKVRFAE